MATEFDPGAIRGLLFDVFGTVVDWRGSIIREGRYALATCSNGNVALMVEMARRGGLPWDAILGAEVTGHYKPDGECYLGSARMLGFPPGQCLMVAAHAEDLDAAATCGLRTALVPRPQEYGPGSAEEARTRAWEVRFRFDLYADDMEQLADKLGC